MLEDEATARVRKATARDDELKRTRALVLRYQRIVLAGEHQ